MSRSVWFAVTLLFTLPLTTPAQAPPAKKPLTATDVLKRAKKALDVLDGAERGWSGLGLADEYAAHGMKKEAREVLETIVGLNAEKSGRSPIVLAGYLVRAGMIEEAVEQVENLIARERNAMGNR